jgi:hypothetical protein
MKIICSNLASCMLNHRDDVQPSIGFVLFNFLIRRFEMLMSTKWYMCFEFQALLQILGFDVDFGL